ncbi:GGDEF domain-containing protein [Enterovibrio sp. ZSDZ35]|uniref:diguanylate cyclase n=1 Tax=Enterovibrio qingdaonensis TaxID=2899818 RepID=A0ABT5QI27_9GAMM|nr:GGDEF domain-containing protein [Enterovibrio sp. ZSDZ35]MDD1780640.1 GGDEF domain-containing protein [Enterovibrio sp. ZSDZ35]
MNQNFSRTVFVLFVLAFFSLASVTWFYAGGARSEYVISPSDYHFRYIDDTPSGGDTLGTVSKSADGKGAVLACTLGERYKWPYCEIAISLTKKVQNGIDLSNYHSMVIEAAYKAPAPDQRLRVYLRNYNEEYSNTHDPVSLKFNGIEYAPTETMSEFVLPLNSFQVLSWWISDLAVPLEHAGPELDNISLIEIATGSAPIIGDHTLTIKSIRFEGLMVTEADLFRTLTFMWMSVVMIILTVKYWQSRATYRLERRRADKLKKINSSLRQQSETLSVLATTDALTGLRNRTEIYPVLNKHLKAANKQVCSALCLDLDHFKAVNDNFGHDMGDQLLVATAQILRDATSTNDIVVRWGGEEFVIFCPTRNLAQATFLAEKIRYSFENFNWPHGESMTCSVGVASTTDHNLAELIADADDALYQAKQSGRNRVEVHMAEHVGS